jgi:hypothetical protein
LIESTQVDDGPLRVGTQIRERRRFLGIQVEMTKEITEFEPTRRSAFKMVAGGGPYERRVHARVARRYDQANCNGLRRASWFFKIAEPLFTSMAGRELEASLGHLKELLKSRLAPIVS